MDEAAVNLPQQVVAAVRERGRGRDLFTTAAELSQEIHLRMEAGSELSQPAPGL